MIKQLHLLLQRNPLLNQIVRFGFVGGSASLTNFVLVVVLVSTAHFTPLIANIIAFIIAFQVSFHGHKKWTFSYEPNQLSTLTKFLTVALGSFILNEALFAVFLNNFHFYYQAALLLVLLIVPPVTFIFSKLWVFKR